jgi:sterol desaturase/sphingolipid hydroxylase (fatty acid hydroxylase superfamily)
MTTVENIFKDTNHNEFILSINIMIAFINLIGYIISLYFPQIDTSKKKTNPPINKMIKYNLINYILSYFLIYGWFQLVKNGYSSINIVDFFPIQFYDIFIIVVSYLLLILFIDFQIYWFHRLLHSSKWLYLHIHAIHHEFTYPDTLFAVIYSNFVNYVIIWFIILWPTLIIPIRLPVFIATIITIILISEFNHIGHDIEIGPYQSRFHHNHHQYYKVNYGEYTQIWDQIFKTYKK